MTRADIEHEYTIRDGQIVSQGKFPGQPIYAPYFWARVLIGFADRETQDGDYIFTVTNQDRQQFPELGKVKTVILAELDSGRIVTHTQGNAFLPLKVQQNERK